MDAHFNYNYMTKEEMKIWLQKNIDNADDNIAKAFKEKNIEFQRYFEGEKTAFERCLDVISTL